MEQRIIVRGALVGALGGLLAFIFGRVFAEPVIQRAIDYESGRDDVQAALDKAAGLTPEAMGPDIFSRTLQSNVGIGLGMILFGVSMGLLFGVVYSVTVRRVAGVSPSNYALLLAGAMFLGVYLVPFLKYPANPPSIGHPETIAARTGLYLLMVGCTLLIGLGAILLGRRLAGRVGNFTGTVLAAGAFIVGVAVVMLVLPSLGHLSANVAEYGSVATETPQPLRDPSGTIVYPGFAADDLYLFRLYSIAAQAILWTTIGVCFAPFATRAVHPENASAVDARSW